MELRHLRYFVALAEELNFTKAAARLHIVQPALSQQIKELEQELGADLFYRSKRKVELSEAGRVFLPEAMHILEQSKHAAALAKSVAQGQIGRVRIGYSAGAVLSGLLGNMVCTYRSLYPNIELSMQQVYPATQVDLLLRGDIDVIFGMSNAVTVPKECRLQPLASFPLYLVLPAAHALAQNKTVHINLLEQEAFIAYSEPEDRHGETFLKSVLGFAPQIVQQTANLLFVNVLVEAGFGLAVMPSTMLKVFTNNVAAVPLAGTNATFNLVAVVRKAGVNPAVKHLLAVAAKTGAGAL